MLLMRQSAAPERRLFRLLAVHPGDDIAAEAAYACDGRSPAETIEPARQRMTPHSVSRSIMS